jgi:hypothetical protein
MPIIIREKQTIIVDDLEDAKERMRFGDILVYENKEYSIPNYRRYNELIDFFKTTKSTTGNNKRKLKELQELTVDVLIWESLR